VFAGTGDAPKVYRVDPQGQSGVFAELPGKYVVSLTVAASDTLCAGVGGSGVVYAIKPDGKYRAVYDSGDQAIGAVRPDGKGGIYVATAPKGYVVKISPDGTAKTLYSKAGKSALGLGLWDHRGAVALYNDKACLVTDDETAMDLENGDYVQYTALAVSAGGDIYVGASNNAALYAYHPSKPKATYESVAHDARVQSTWGRIRWTADVPEGARIAFQTRSGETSEPDNTWGPWSAISVEPGQHVSSAPARYVQYRAILEGANWDTLPILKDVSISFLTRNQPPTLKITAPLGGEVWSRKQTIKWAGLDPDGDTLTYRAYYSADSGKTWQELTESKAAGARAAVTDEAKTDEQKAGDEETKDEKPGEITVTPAKPETSESKGGQSLASFAAKAPKSGASKQQPEKTEALKAPAPAASSALAAALAPPQAPTTSKGPIKSTSYSWDTTKVADGRYIIKVAVSDATSNAANALSAEKVSDPITVCNKPPSLFAREQDVKIGEDRRATTTGLVSSELVRIVGVDYKLDAAEWMATEPVDGMFDSPTEEFRITTDELTKGEHQMEVKAVDAAGNSAVEKLKVKVE